MQRVDDEVVTARGLEGDSQVLLVDAELGRPGAAVQALGVPAHDAAARVDAQASSASRPATSRRPPPIRTPSCSHGWRLVRSSREPIAVPGRTPSV